MEPVQIFFIPITLQAWMGINWYSCGTLKPFLPVAPQAKSVFLVQYSALRHAIQMLYQRVSVWMLPILIVF